MQSDAVAFAAPSYSFQVSAFMKIFLDRLGFVLHRSRFFGRTCTSIIAHGLFGANKLVTYLDFVGGCLDFNPVKGTCVTAREQITESEELKINRAVARQSQRFYERMMKPAYPVPLLLMLMGFRMGRTIMKLELDDSSFDYRYYKDKGWFESDYFYPVRLGVSKKLAGRLFDTMARITTRKRISSSALSSTQ